MPATIVTSTENNFTKGLITEATGFNFPENAATSTSNCIYSITGDVTRREGINNELNGTTTAIDRTLKAMSSYVWNNPGGDGNSKLLVKQVGNTLYFYNIATATVASPLSTKKLAGTATLMATSGGTFDATLEATYADGNGYLFVYHPSCDPQYVTYNANTLAIAINQIQVQTRDFVGVVDNMTVNTRPTTLSADHQYNLLNQGWTAGSAWYTISNSSKANPYSGSLTFTVDAGLGATIGQIVSLYGLGPRNDGILTNGGDGQGTVTAYSGTSMTISVFSSFVINTQVLTLTATAIQPISTGYLNTWNTAEGNYPSNSDVWWYFKNSTGVFDPATTQPNVDLSTGQAPQGHYILPAFNMNRTAVSGIASLTTVSTLKRPTNGCWFQGRVWYTGVSDTFAATGDSNYYTWTENIYYSTSITTPTDFGICYQTNDPTSETLNGELPTDGGVVFIQGAGTIHRLFPIANGLLVFANNGIWFITGSQGIGFASNDFTITQLSKIKILSYDSFVDVNGLPFFWNEEGIYMVQPTQNGTLTVEPLTVSTILTYYNEIPLASKKYARGSYDPINYLIHWVFRSTQESSVTNRYQYDTILAYNTYTKAFYIYNLSNGPNTNYIHGVDYISYPYISTATPDPGFKYLCSNLIAGTYNHGIAEEYDDNFVDWGSTNFISTFTTGYKIHGKGLMKTQIPYVTFYNRNDGNYAAYYIQGLWDYGINFDSNRWSQPQLIEIFETNTSTAVRRPRIRGRGYALQLQVTSLDGQPFDIIGWAVFETINQGP